MCLTVVVFHVFLSLENQVDVDLRGYRHSTACPDKHIECIPSFEDAVPVNFDEKTCLD